MNVLHVIDGRNVSVVPHVPAESFAKVSRNSIRTTTRRPQDCQIRPVNIPSSVRPRLLIPCFKRSACERTANSSQRPRANSPRPRDRTDAGLRRSHCRTSTQTWRMSRPGSGKTLCREPCDGQSSGRPHEAGWLRRYRTLRASHADR